MKFANSGINDLEDALRSGAMSAKSSMQENREILITIMSESDLRCFEEMERDAEQEKLRPEAFFITLASKVVVNVGHLHCDLL